MAIDIKKYREFLLLANIIEKDEGSNHRLAIQVVSSPAGEARSQEPSIPADLQSQLRLLENRKLSIDGIVQLGETLAQILFPDDIRELFVTSRKMLEPDQGLRLRLQLDAGLSSIPWEYMYIRQMDGFVALQPRISIVRHESVSMPTAFDTTPKPRRLLVAMASPESGNYAKLDLQRDRTNLQEALRDISELTLVFPKKSTFQSFTDELETGADIVHFAGHGDFSKTGLGTSRYTQVGEGLVLFTTEDNQPAPIPAEQFASRLRDRGVQLAVLGACQTGRRDEENIWSSVVAALMQKGVPAAVAMQYKIWDKSAIEFTRGFYRALARGLPLDWAVTEGRLAVYDLCNPLRDDAKCGIYWRDWGVPVFYLRAYTEEEKSAQMEFVLPAISKSEQVSGTSLHELLVKYFDEEELRTLCFELEVDYDSLRGEGKANKARELVLYAQRIGSSAKLLAYLKKERPNVFH